MLVVIAGEVVLHVMVSATVEVVVLQYWSEMEDEEMVSMGMIAALSLSVGDCSSVEGDSGGGDDDGGVY